MTPSSGLNKKSPIFPAYLAWVIVCILLALAPFRQGFAKQSNKPEVDYAKPTRQLMEQKIGIRPSEKFYLVEVLHAWDLPNEAKRLKAYLLYHYFEEVAGTLHDEKITVAQAIDPENPMAKVNNDWKINASLKEKFSKALKQKLTPIIHRENAEIPKEITAGENTVREFAPGFWAELTYKGDIQKVYFLLEAQNQSQLTIPLKSFGLNALDESDKWKRRSWCWFSQGPSSLLQDIPAQIIKPNQGIYFLCSSEPEFAETASKKQLIIEIDSISPMSVEDSEKIADFLAAQGKSQLDGLMDKNKACMKKRECGVEKPFFSWSKSQGAPKPSQPSSPPLKPPPQSPGF